MAEHLHEGGGTFGVGALADDGVSQSFFHSFPDVVLTLNLVASKHK